MPKFYATMSRNQAEYHHLLKDGHAGSGGVIEIEATDYRTAREKIGAKYGPKWAFMYETLDEVHPLDRTILDRI